MTRREAVSAAKTAIAEFLSMHMNSIDDTGVRIESTDQCLDDPRAVQVICRIWHAGVPDGETIQLEVTTREILG